MAKVTYAQRRGFKIRGGASAVQKKGEYLERLRKRHGMLTPHIVVEDAEDEDSPLHEEFEWDDTEAARRWRIEQAGHLLRAIVIVRKPSNGDPEFVRAFVHLSDAEEGSLYTSIAIAMANPEMRQQVLQQAWKELEGWRERYKEYQELANVFEAIDAARLAG